MVSRCINYTEKVREQCPRAMSDCGSLTGLFEGALVVREWMSQDVRLWRNIVTNQDKLHQDIVCIIRSQLDSPISQMVLHVNIYLQPRFPQIHSWCS